MLILNAESDLTSIKRAGLYWASAGADCVEKHAGTY